MSQLELEICSQANEEVQEKLFSVFTAISEMILKIISKCLSNFDERILKV